MPHHCSLGSNALTATSSAAVPSASGARTIRTRGTRQPCESGYRRQANTRMICSSEAPIRSPKRSRRFGRSIRRCLSKISPCAATISLLPACAPGPTSGKCWRACSMKCSRTPLATPGSICSPVSKALLYALVAAAGNVLGALAVTRRAVRELRVIELLVAFGAGFMLSVAIVELLPAALSRSGAIAPALVLAGYLAVHLTQHTVTPHFHFGEETHAVSSVAGTSALVGLLLHTFFDGVAIASAFLVRPELGMLMFIAIFLHKLPEGVTISSLMLAGGRSGGRAVGAAALLGIATLLGVVLTDQVGFLVQHGLALSAGVTIYVAASNLVPEFQGKRGWRLPAAFFSGALVFFLTKMLMEC